MKHKLKNHFAVNETGMLFSTQTGDSFQANERGVMIIEKNRKYLPAEHIEDYILSEFNIDSETMEEHLAELLLFMKFQDREGKLHHH